MTEQELAEMIAKVEAKVKAEVEADNARRLPSGSTQEYSDILPINRARSDKNLRGGL